MEGDTGEELARVLSHCRVPEVLSTRVTTAYETPSDFAFAFPRLESLDAVLRDLDENTVQALNLPAGQETPLQPARRTPSESPQDMPRCQPKCSIRQPYSQDADTSQKPG